MTLPLASVNELHIQIAAHCPSCDRAMTYIRYDPGSDIKQVWCKNNSCPEVGRKWNLNMRSGIARRAE